MIKPSKPSDTLPYVLPIDHTRFVHDINCQEGRLIQSHLDGIPCARCGKTGVLRLSGTLVARPFITCSGDRLILPVPIVKCDECGCRRRVLSSDALPFKTYSLGRIEALSRGYLLTGRSLRAVTAAASGPYAPHASTLHGWLGGLGERVLDQVHLAKERAVVDGKPELVPFTSVIEETRRETGAPTARTFSATVHVRPEKYRSERRREHLEACLRLFAMAEVIPSTKNAGEPSSLEHLERLGLLAFRMPVLLFRSRIRNTPIQHDDPSPPAYKGPSGNRNGGAHRHGCKESRP